MKVIDIINEVISDMVNEDNNVWYHGSNDGRELMKNGSFLPRTKETTYVTDPKKYKETQTLMRNARASGDEKTYFKILDTIGSFNKKRTYKQPIYFSNNRSVANTYADDKRSFDYQNSESKLFRVNINDNGNILTIPAYGESFRGINADIVRKALLNKGISEEEINTVFDMYPNDIWKGKMTAESLAIIAQQLNFDIVDVLGVLDSYNVGTTKSIVRMVFDPNRIKIIGDD